MAIKFLEPGGDADFVGTAGLGISFWVTASSGVAVTTDFVHGTHIKSIKYRVNTFDSVKTPVTTVADAGSRVSFYIYINAFPSATASVCEISDGSLNALVHISITSGGVLQLTTLGSSGQIGTNGATLSTATWYRISLAYTVTSTSVNRFECFLDGKSTISVTNATIPQTGSSRFVLGNNNGNSTLDIRTSDHYVDDSNSLKDMGNIWVTAKRPVSNGTTNGFTTQIGSGGSGTGTGHSPQVNERALSNTNGWSMIGAGSAVTEEYNIETTSAGDIDVSKGTVIDYLGWVDAKSALAETGSIVVGGASSNISLTSTETLFTKIKGSSTYPAGTGTDIGIITSTTVTTVSLYECGVIVAFIPAATISVSDSSAIGESVSITNIEYINVSDSSTVGETKTLSITSNINNAESSAVSDVGIMSLLSRINVNDSTVVSDSITFSGQEAVNKTDLDVVSDSLGNSITFNGTSSDVVTIGNSYQISTAGFTIELWYNSTTWTSNARVVDYQDAGPSGGVTIVQAGSTGVLQVAIRNVGTTTAALNTAALTDGVWYHIMVAFDGTISTLYVNGVQAAQDTSTTMSAPTQTVTIGRRSATSTNFFTGSIAAFRIYGRSLTSTESLQHFQGVFINETSLQVWYKFVSGVAFDFSGSSNTGTITGTTQTGFTINPYVIIELFSPISVTDSTTISDAITFSSQFPLSVSDSSIVSDTVSLSESVTAKGYSFVVFID